MATKKTAAKKVAAKKAPAKAASGKLGAAKAPAKKAVAKKTAAKKTVAKKVVVKRPSKTSDKGAIELKVETGGQVYETKTDNVAEAIENLGIDNTFTQTVITAKANGHEVVKVYNVHMMRRILRNKLTRDVLAKNVNLALALPPVA